MRHRPESAFFAATALWLGATAGCSYASDYRPPADGRARPLWKDDRISMVAPEALPRCAHEVQPERAAMTYEVPLDEAGYYEAPTGGPTTVGVHVVVHGPGFVPLPGGPPPLGGGGGSMDGDAAKVVLVGLAVAAIVVFPFVALGLALGHPEPADEVAFGIDTINHFNDQARARAAMCAATAPERGARR